MQRRDLWFCAGLGLLVVVVTVVALVTLVQDDGKGTIGYQPPTFDTPQRTDKDSSVQAELLAGGGGTTSLVGSRETQAGPRQALDDLMSYYTSHRIADSLPPSTGQSLLPWYPETAEGERLPEFGVLYTTAMIKDAQGALQLLIDLAQSPDPLRDRLAVAYFLSMSPQLLGNPVPDPAWAADEVTEQLLDAVLARDDEGSQLAAALLLMTQRDRSYSAARLIQLEQVIRAKSDARILWHLRGATRTRLRVGDAAMIDMMFRLIESPWNEPADEQRAGLAASNIFETQTLAHPIVAARVPAVIRKYADHAGIMILAGLRMGDDDAPAAKREFFDALADVLPVIHRDARDRAVESLCRIDASRTIDVLIDRDDELRTLPPADHRNVLTRVEMNWSRRANGSGNSAAVEASLWGAATMESASPLLRQWAHRMLGNLLVSRIESGAGQEARSSLRDLLTSASNDPDPEIRDWGRRFVPPPR